MPRGSTPANPLFVSQGALGGGATQFPTGMFSSGAGMSYSQRMAASRGGLYGMSRGMGGAMGMKGVGIGAVGALAGGLMMQSENEAMQIGGAALSGAGTGAMIGSVIPGIGTVAGAGIGAAIGGLTAWLEKKDKQEEKEKNAGGEKYDKMIKLLEEQAKKDTKIFMDANQVGIAMTLGNPRLN